jgi:hypothetical protein
MPFPSAAAESEHTIIGLLNATPQRYNISRFGKEAKLMGTIMPVIMRFLMGVKLDYNCRLTPLAAEQFYISRQLVYARRRSQ